MFIFRKREQGRGREREREKKIPGRLHTVSTKETNAGLDFMNHEIMT